MKIKKGDNVIVITGKDKGKTGSVERVFPKKDLVLVSGVNVVKRHQKARKSAGKGQIVDKAMPIHISNVASTEKKAKAPKKVAKKA
ncbi:MAG: 50S ribosomal protein L24 [Patescibacteria group bacterium]